eukprot:143151_1
MGQKMTSEPHASTSGETHQEMGFNEQIDSLIDEGKIPARNQHRTYTFYTRMSGMHQAVIVTWIDYGGTHSLKIDLVKKSGRSNYCLRCSDVKPFYDDSENDKRRSIDITMGEIKKAANHVIVSFGSYDKIANNCQHFAIRFLKQMGAVSKLARAKTTDYKIATVGVVSGGCTIVAVGPTAIATSAMAVLSGSTVTTGTATVAVAAVSTAAAPVMPVVAAVGAVGVFGVWAAGASYT